MDNNFESNAPLMKTWYDNMTNALVKDIEEKLKMDEKEVPEVEVLESLASINLGATTDELIKFCDSKRTRLVNAAQKLMNEFHYPYESEDVTNYLDEASYYGQIISKLEKLKTYEEKEALKDFEKSCISCRKLNSPQCKPCECAMGPEDHSLWE